MEKNCEMCSNKIFCYKNFNHCMGFQPKEASTERNCETCRFDGKCPHSLTCGLKQNMWKPKSVNTSTVLTVTDEDMESLTAELAAKFKDYPHLDFSFWEDYKTETRWLLELKDDRTRHEIAKWLEKHNAITSVPGQKTNLGLMITAEDYQQFIAELKK